MLSAVFLCAAGMSVHLASLSAGKSGAVTLVPGQREQGDVIMNVPQCWVCECARAFVAA